MFIALILGAMPVRALDADKSIERQSYDQRLDNVKISMSSDPASVREQAAAIDREIRRDGITPEERAPLAKARWLQGEALLRLNKPQPSEPLLNSAFRLISADQTAPKLRADIMLSRGNLDTARARVADALRDYHDAYAIFRQLRDARSEAIALQNIASLYRDANDLQNALKYDAQAADTYQGDASLTIYLKINHGNTLFHLKRYADADVEYRLALALARKLGSTTLQTTVLANIALNDVARHDTKGAEAALKKAFSLTTTPETQGWLPQLYAIRAAAAFETGDLSSAESSIGRSFSFTDADSSMLDDRDAHETAYKIYKKLGRDDLALAHLEAQKRLDDQAASLAASANTALMAARFDYTNQNLKIAQLQAQDLQRKIAFERAHARTVRMAFISAGGVTILIIALLAIGIVIIRRSRNQERAAKLGLAEANSALAKALAAKTEFLATTSHEIRTPLNGILGMTQVMLADPKLAADTRERLGVVQSAGVTMRALVDDILDVAKMETGNMTIEHAPMDVCQVLTDVARVWRDQAEDRGIAFVLSVDECPARVMGDAARLRQVVFNLLSNALKFTERGRIELGGSVVETERGRRVRITVTDTGIGIAPDKIDEVFESFRQAEASTTRRFGGTGLGLAICRSLARAMDGDVSVKSRLGEGTVFTVELPLIHAEEEPVACDEPGGASLLIVDRNPITRSMLRALLEERAGAVHLAGSIDDARVLLASGNVANVLIDDSAIRCLGDDWRPALAGLVEGAPTATHFTALWRLDDPAEAAAITAAGIDQLIEKPVAGPVLRDALYPINATKRYNEGDTVLVSNAA